VKRLRLGVNIDHVATVRNARGEGYPDPVRAAEVALAAGADGITAHLREDRRHISDTDIEALAVICRRRGRPLNFECAVTPEMEAIALAHRPHAACLVPERREEVTTEGGLDMIRGANTITPVVRRLAAAGIRVSAFIDADDAQVTAAKAAGAHVVELHTGASELGLEVHAGHGIDFETVKPIAAIPEVVELNIGHFLIGEAIFIGLGPAIQRMRGLMDEAHAASHADPAFDRATQG
jgi:pyridoxine 5-phosphate synthase